MSDKNFSVRNEIWDRMESRWRMAWDFWRGGINVLQPDHVTHMSRSATYTGSGGIEPYDGPDLGEYSWTTYPTNSYLWKHERESGYQYSERQARQIHFPIFQLVVNTLASGILGVAPTRGEKTPQEPWATYWYDVDMAGTNIDAFVRQALSIALVFGRAHAITDRVTVDGQLISRADEINNGVRTYSYLCTPLDIVDWCLDDKGSFVWAVICELGADYRMPGMASSGRRANYRVWTRDHWELYEEERSDMLSAPKYRLIDAGAHALGRVPIDTLWATKDARPTSMDCESPLSDILDIDRDILNKLSELDELERAQAFSILWLPDAEGMSTGPIDIGPWSAFHGPSEAGAPQYISPDNDIPAGKLERIEKKLLIARQLVGVSRGKSEYSKEERSAEALTVESEDKRNQMVRLVSSTAEFDRSIHDTVSLWEGGVEYPIPEYAKKYDHKSTISEIQQLLQIKSIDIFSPRAMGMIAKPILSKMLRENGVAEEKIQELLKEIDSTVDKKEEMQDNIVTAMQDSADDKQEESIEDNNKNELANK